MDADGDVRGQQTDLSGKDAALELTKIAGDPGNPDRVGTSTADKEQHHQPPNQTLPRRNLSTCEATSDLPLLCHT